MFTISSGSLIWLAIKLREISCSPHLYGRTRKRVNAAAYPEIDIPTLVSDYRKKLINMLTKLCQNPDQAEDLAHDTLMIVILKLEDGAIRNPDRLASYIYSTGRYLYFGSVRKKENKVELWDSMEDFESAIPIQEEVVATNWAAESIRRSINKLPKVRDREILTRSYFNDQTKEEICDALLLSNAHNDRVISRARQRLRKITIETQHSMEF